MDTGAEVRVSGVLSPSLEEVDGVVAQFKGAAAVEQDVVAHFAGGFEAGVFLRPFRPVIIGKKGLVEEVAW